MVQHPTSPEVRFDALAGQVNAFAETHNDPSLRGFYHDFGSLMTDPSTAVGRLSREIASIALKISAVDLANTLPRQLIAQELIGPDPDPNDPSLMAFDADTLRGRKQPGSWLEPLRLLDDSTEAMRFIGGCLLPTQSNPPGRGRLLKFVSLLYGIQHPTIAEFGTSAGLILKQAALEHNGFPHRNVNVGHPIRAEKGFAPNFLMTELVNRMLQSTNFSPAESTGFDLLPPRNLLDLARIKAYTMYVQEFLDGTTGPELQRLIDAPNPASVRLVAEDLSIDPAKFAEQHAAELGRYDIVYVPTMLYSYKKQPGTVEAIIQNANAVRKAGGLLVIQDYVRFLKPIVNDKQSPYRNKLKIYDAWPPYSYSTWVDDGSKAELDFTLIASSETGRANQWWLPKKIAQRVVGSPFAL